MKDITLTTALRTLIHDSKTKIRIQKNGKPLSKGSITNYSVVLKNLVLFETFKQKNYIIKIHSKRYARNLRSENSYWVRFYRDFRKFLYNQRGAHDNYVSMHLKILKVVFKYLRQDKFYPIGNYEHIFYSPRINYPINIFPMDRLQHLVTDYMNLPLPVRQKEILAVFIFGIAVGLRYSDLKALKATNVVVSGDGTYIETISRKTATATRVKLPGYALAILKNYGHKKGPLFDLPQLQTFNTNLKSIARQLGWDWPVQHITSRYGKIEAPEILPFNEVISSHVMRRTTITALLSQGVSETIVRQISGHAPGSTEFYRYVKLSQQHIDKAVDAAWDKICHPKESILTE